MIADNVAVLARRALDQNSAFVVALFRDAVGGAVATRLAGECELIGGLTRSFEETTLAGFRGIVGSDWDGELGVVADREVGEWCWSHKSRT